MTDAPLITDEQVAALNLARTTLEAIARTAHHDHDSQASGMIFARATAAEHDLFELLNWVRAYGHADIPDAQLHNR